MGILIAGPLRQAVFAEPGSHRPLILREGDQLGPYRVDAIEPRRVRLDGPAGRRVLLPGADPATRADLAAAIPLIPYLDPYRRELETENDQ